MPVSPSNFRTFESADLPVDRGRLVFTTVKSIHLLGRGDTTLYIPENIDSNQIVPVVILLHGVYCSHWAWALKGRAHERLQQLIDEDEIPPMILVMPSDGLWGDGSGYFPHNDRNFEKWIVEDIPLLVQEVTGNSTEASHFIAGLSMGGYGAMRLGAAYPDRFKAFSGHSSVTDYEDLTKFIEEFKASYGIDKSKGPSTLNTILENRDNLAPFRFDCGVDDLLIDSNRKLAEQLKEADLNFVYEEFPGGHEWPYWNKHIQKSYKFFAELL